MLLGAGAQVDLTRGIVEFNRAVAMVASDDATVLTLTDVLVRDTQADAAGDFGRGLGVNAGARVDVTRAIIERNRNTGAAATGASAVLTLTDVIVRDTEGQESDGLFGRGVDASAGAQVQITRAIVERSHDIGVRATGYRYGALRGAVENSVQLQSGCRRLRRFQRPAGQQLHLQQRGPSTVRGRCLAS